MTTDKAGKSRTQENSTPTSRKQQYLQALRLLGAEVRDLRQQLNRIKDGNLAAKDSRDYFSKTGY